MEKELTLLVTYAVNRNDQNGEHITMHSTRVYFEGPAAEDCTAADVLNRLIWQVANENPEIASCNISLVNYWEI